jgi:regulator of nucleoside diphosphate kinase
MKGHSIIVTDADLDRLSCLARALKLSLSRSAPTGIVGANPGKRGGTSSERIPKDVIRMNSRIGVLDFDTRKIEFYTLVFPENANISTGGMSVLAPVGIALLGHRQGDVIETKVPGGTRRLRVERVLNTSELARERVRPDRTRRRELHSGGTFQRTTLAA